MATSGTFQSNQANFTGNITFPSYIYVNWSITQIIENNQSTLTWSAFGGSYNTDTQNYSDSGPIRLWIDRQQVLNITSDNGFRLKKGQLLGSGTIPITHNPDGTRDVPVQIEAWISYGTAGGTRPANSTYSGTITLDRIPRGIMHLGNAGASRRGQLSMKTSDVWRNTVLWEKNVGIWKQST